MAARRFVACIVCLAACNGTTGTDIDIDTEPCALSGDPQFEFAQDLTGGVHAAGEDIWYGLPPQGGAPYAPFQIRIEAELDPGVRIPVEASAVDVATDEEIGTASQAQAFICSNTGVHEGWLFGGEVHIRFWDLSLDELAGRAIDVRLWMDDGAGLSLEGSSSGTLVLRE